MGTHHQSSSNEYPESVFWNKTKNNVYHCKLQVSYEKMGFKGVYFKWICPNECEQYLVKLYHFMMWLISHLKKEECTYFFQSGQEV